MQELTSFWNLPTWVNQLSNGLSAILNANFVLPPGVAAGPYNMTVNVSEPTGTISLHIRDTHVGFCFNHNNLDPCLP